MNRQLDWPERLNDVIDAARARPFDDEHHCAGFAAECVGAMTGEWPSELCALPLTDAYRAMRKAGFKDVPAAVEAVLGPPIALAFARRGDIVLRRSPKDELVLGVCCGELSAFVDVEGLSFLPTLEQHAAYSVPF